MAKETFEVDGKEVTAEVKEVTTREFMTDWATHQLKQVPEDATIVMHIEAKFHGESRIFTINTRNI